MRRPIRQLGNEPTSWKSCASALIGKNLVMKFCATREGDNNYNNNSSRSSKNKSNNSSRSVRSNRAKFPDRIVCVGTGHGYNREGDTITITRAEAEATTAAATETRR